MNIFNELLINACLLVCAAAVMIKTKLELAQSAWAASAGILRNSQFARFLNVPLRKIQLRSRPSPHDIVVGWGVKPNTKKAKNFACQRSVSYLHLEDGFISYLTHPSESDSRLSLIIDERGIYYDASAPSDVEDIINSESQWFDSIYLERARYALHQITTYGITKYNTPPTVLPDFLVASDKPCLLLVDQTYGDQSVRLSGDDQAFDQMLQDALNLYPEHQIIIKTHPDVLVGKKRGYFPSELAGHERIRFLSANVSIAELMLHVERVFTVTSQLGFEALMYGKPVHCYGMPFYAGWGLTLDQQSCSRRVAKPCLEALVAAALMRYPIYLHPETQKLCELEDVLDWLVLQRQDEANCTDECIVVGFSLWKRAFIKAFIGRLAGKVSFVKDVKALNKYLQRSSSRGSRAVLVWGCKHLELETQLPEDTQIWRVEDGFIRSVGLGADLRRPSSLVIDQQGIYCFPHKNSDIISLLNGVDLDAAQLHRATQLIDSLNSLALTKYNVGVQQDQTLSALSVLRQQAGNRSIILVPGQYEKDQSVKNSLGKIKTNYSLLSAVRADYPEAFIIFKEHPDLYSGTRPGALGQQRALTVADAYVSDIDMHSLLLFCDRVCTLTSLTGFEALIRGRKVSVYGSPFYAGWGLTDDRLSDLPNRQQHLSLESLVHICLVRYSRCVDWNTRHLTTPESTMQLLAKERQVYLTQSNHQLNSSWLPRQLRRARYVYNAFAR